MEADKNMIEILKFKDDTISILKSRIELLQTKVFAVSMDKARVSSLEVKLKQREIEFEAGKDKLNNEILFINKHLYELNLALRDKDYVIEAMQNKINELEKSGYDSASSKVIKLEEENKYLQLGIAGAKKEMMEEMMVAFLKVCDDAGIKHNFYGGVNKT